jgi:hypothetical protein
MLNVALPQEDAHLYRLRVQNALYVFADNILRSGGVLNIVDRGAIATTPEWIEPLRLDTVQSHGEQASPTSLKIDPNIETRPYNPPSGQGVKMAMTLGMSGVLVPEALTGFVSVIARKP